MPTVSGKAKGRLNKLFKDIPLPNLPLFISQAHLLLAKPYATLQIGFLSIPCPHGHPFEEVTFASHSISAMERVRAGHTDPLVSREARPRASSA